MKHVKSKEAFIQACKVLPGGVDSPVRSFASVQETPLFVDHAYGANIVDIDGNTYIDYIGSWGPMILGHASEIVHKDIMQAVEKGISYGLPCVHETTLAKLVIDAYPGLEMLRFVTSGTEATMSCIRAARGYTKRDKIIKFEGCYHGHSDALLVKSGSGALTFAQPDSLGIPATMVEDTILCTYNDISSVEQMVQRYPTDIAAIILEPIAGNMGVIAATMEFLQGLRRLCNEYGILLIFDEVISGFRVAYGGAAAYYGITPDMACFGKIIGAGMSVGAYGGRRDIMEIISPKGGVYQAGTLAGNPLAMQLGIRQLTYLRDHPEVYTKLETYGASMEKGIVEILQRHQLPYQVHRVGSLLTIFFTKKNVQCFQDVQACNLQAFAKYYQCLLQEGILCAPSQFEAIFISLAHTQEDLDKTLTAMEKALVASVL